MFGNSSKKILLLLLLVFSFAYRLLLMTWNTFPPGADIGIHESVIKSLSVGDTKLFLHQYHMGGGISATNPGYHIFTAFASSVIGAPDYLIHSIVVSFFSAITVLCVFLIVRRIWNESAAFIAAFLIIFSRGDISILCWGGYPNIIALFLTPVVFYLYLQHSRFSSSGYLVGTSLLIGALFLTHVFSAFVFATLTISTLFIGAIFSKKTRLSIRQIVTWTLPIVFGALLVSPYLFMIVPLYFGPEGTITGTVLETKQALLATRTVPIELVFLCIIPALLFFAISKYYKRRYLTISAVLFAVWILIPAIMTQSHMLGIYLDYERFQYFIYFPLIVCTALLIESGSRIFSKTMWCLFNSIKQKTNEPRRSWFITTPNAIFSRKVVYSLLVIVLLFFSLFYLPFLTPPNEGFDEAKYYQVMTSSGYDAIQWIKDHTPPNSVLVSDAEYGWWLSGFAQRPTLSAVNPQFLILAHEIEAAEIARNILNFDYFIDNGILLVNSYKSNVEEENFEVTARLNYSSIPYPFFSIKNPKISLLYRNNGTPRQLSFVDFPTANMHIRNGSNWASFQITMENQLFVFKESVTIYTGVRFAKISINLQSKVEDISFDWFFIPFMSHGAPTQYNNSIGFVDSSVNTLNQMIFPDGQLGSEIILQKNPNNFELVINFEGKSTAQLEFFAGFCPYKLNNIQNITLHNIMEITSNTYFDKVSNLSLAFFDYQTAIKVWNVSYVVITNFETVQRFAIDPFFSRVYQNDEVTIFKINNNSK